MLYLMRDGSFLCKKSSFNLNITTFGTSFHVLKIKLSLALYGCLFRNKLDENRIMTRNKARIVAIGYSQVEGIVYEETYFLVAHLEVIQLLLAFSCCLNIKLYHMDVKSYFLNEFMNEEVYISQPPSFEDHENPIFVFKFKQALYYLKQALRAWYERLSGFLIKKDLIMVM